MKKFTVLVFSFMLLTSLAFTNYSSPEEFEPKHYDNAKVLRVKFTQGEAFVTRSYEEGFEEAAINLPIFEKDSVGTTDGRLEIYLGRLNYLRLDHDSEVTFDKVPELRKTGMTLRIIKGGIYINVESIDYERDIEIQTPDCGVFVLDKGKYRINVTENGRTEIYVFDGMAEVAGEDFNRNVRENQKVVMLDGRVKERPFYFYSSDNDDFDQWNNKRNGIVGYARYSSSRYLDNGYEEQEYELSRNGRWRYNSTYGSYVWIPYSVGVDWRPYYRGRWISTPQYGYVWHSYDPWGSFTHHYGRWHWDPILHWHWIPGYRWSPAWVSWFSDDYYYGWCPMSWWNRPVVVYNGRWWRNHRYRRGIPFHARSTTIIKKGHLSTRNIHKRALRRGDTAKLSKKSIIFKGHAPKIRSNVQRIKVINAKGKTVLYKKGAISKLKYKSINTKVATTKGIKKDGLSKKSVTYKYAGKKISKRNFSKYSSKTRTGSISKTTVKHTPYKSGGISKSSPETGSPYNETNKYKPSKYNPLPRSGTKSPTRYGYKPYSKSKSSSKSKTSSKSSYKYRPKSKSKSGYKSRPKSKSKSSYKPSGSSKKSSTKKSSSSYKPVKKKKNYPSYSSYSPKSSSSYNSGSSYSSSSSSKRKTSSYGSSYKSSYKSKPRSSYKSSYKSSSSYKPYSKSNYSSKSSYKSSYKPSRSKSSYKPSRSSSKSRSRSSSSRSRSSSSKSSSSKSSSSGSYKKK
jgi:Family of unknown function (DUF6600)